MYAAVAALLLELARRRDLFGCHRDRLARTEQAGSLWLLNGDRLIVLTENTGDHRDAHRGAADLPPQAERAWP